MKWLLEEKGEDVDEGPVQALLRTSEPHARSGVCIGYGYQLAFHSSKRKGIMYKDSSQAHTNLPSFASRF